VNLAEGVQLVSFALLTVIMLGSALGVVLFSNIVYSAFLLGGVFVGMAGLYILLNADFIAAAQVLIYVGAVNVLILFAIMLVNKREDFKPIPGSAVRQAATAVVCVGLFALLGAMVVTTPWSIVTPGAAASTAVSIAAVGIKTGDTSIVKLGLHFFSDYLLPFEITSVLLLVALVGAIVLARRDLIPQILSRKGEDEALMLPERPRELVGAGVPNDRVK
jgi:NAD(P)H-quinone oxidoreductase subunit 6